MEDGAADIDHNAISDTRNKDILDDVPRVENGVVL